MEIILKKTGTKQQQWQRDSAIKGVEFKLDNPDAGHDAQTQCLDVLTKNDGWVYGEEKMRCLRHITV
jgi:hypothetical protein